MSGNSNDAPGRREVAHRLFAAEFDDADLEYADSDEERAPKYVIVPTGARVNRLFVVGVLTELERVNEDVVRARVVDPTGAFVVYAGQYQPDALAFLERTEPPAFVAITGKANAFRPEDSDRVFTSIRPESVAEVDAETRDRWTVGAAAHTLDRIGEFARSFAIDDEDGDLEEALRARLDPERANGIALAREHYGTTPAYLDALRESALDAARQVAGETDSVEAPGIAPGEDDGREVDLDRLRASGEAPAADTEDEPDAAHEPEESEAEPTTSASESSDAEIGTVAETTAPEPDAAEPDAASAAETGAEPDETGPSGSGVDRDVDAEASAETEPEPSTGETGSSIAAEGSSTTDAADVEAETEPTSEPEPSDELGDFEPSSSGSTETEPETTSPSERDAEPSTESSSGVEAADEEAFYELDDEERAEVEEEFGVDFSTGGEVGEPGEAGIDVPDADDLAELEAEAEAETGVEPDAQADADEPEAAEPDEAAEPEPESEEPDVNVEDSAMETMRELAGGDGADREEVVSRVADEHGVDPAVVDDAIESALMSGRCYEPRDGVLKPI